ncbi:DUF6714 family protein [Limnoglobus roseus]|uniref:Uncharacterized protein n=1 Tax=Limnoglobus roseus TaxID=2598579 RepID=A0A5C1ABA5_9BACT|nr:DUF6714 family protein [Limnoglobus roseus]QEL14308.1 hypothetical protein PX52LOC_01180 [Limnoglobus roseus]
MTDRQRELLQMIEDAFRGVELGDGVSLHESAVIDDYGTLEERRVARVPDEKRDWHKAMLEPDLPRLFDIGCGVLSFLDAQGMRFYLPACLMLLVGDHDNDLYGNMFESLEFQLTCLGDYNRERFDILNTIQRQCVCEVLTYLRDSMEDLEFEPRFRTNEINHAIDGYWSLPHA